MNIIIVDKLFDYISIHEKIGIEYIIVNKQWYQASLPHLFKKLYISTLDHQHQDIHTSPHLLSKLVKKVNSFALHTHYIKELHLDMTYLSFSHTHSTITSTILTKKSTPNVDHKRLSISSTSPINMLTSFFLSSPHRKQKQNKRKQSTSSSSFSSSYSPPPLLMNNNMDEEDEEDEYEMDEGEEIYYCQYCLRLYDIADIITQLLNQSQYIETLTIDFNHRPFKMMTLTNICDDAIHYFFTQLVKHSVQFPLLKSLTIQHLPKLVSYSPSDGGHSFWYWLTHILKSPTSLQLIEVTTSLLQNEFINMLHQWSTSASNSLRSFTIDGLMLQWNSSKESEDIPQLYLPPSLHSFTLKDYHPFWFQDNVFSILKQDCPHLKRLAILDSGQRYYYNWKQQSSSQQNKNNNSDNDYNKDMTLKIMNGMIRLLHHCTELEQWSIQGFPHSFQNDDLLRFKIIELATRSTSSHDIYHRDHDIWQRHLDHLITKNSNITS
ncbi:hypothetical protein BJ944DRAFT_286759 [Cunninghamella echinulata]|nr:hypothetical protein BJ944DRAFT_286759 [Cunninghamella echinulata]